MVLSAAPKAPFINLTVEQGLTSNTINCIYKDSRNFIWLGTANGLNRFDGVDLLSFDEFKDKSIISILEADSANLYIISDKNLFKYNRASRHNSLLRLNDVKNHHLKAFAIDKNRNLYILNNNDIYELEADSKIASKLNNELLLNKTLKDIIIDNDNICWIICYEGLIKYDLSSQQASMYDAPADHKFSCFTEHKGTLYIATEGGAIFSFDIETKHFQLIHRVESSYIQTISYYQDKLYVGTNGNGLKILSLLQNEEIASIVHNPSIRNTISSNAIYSLLIDENSFFVGTFSGGVNYTPKTKNVFKTLDNHNGIKSDNQNIRSFTIDNNGYGIWGTRSGLVYNSERTTKIYNTENTSNLKSNIILTVQPFGPNFLFGTYKGGVYLFESSSNSIKRFNEDPIFIDNSIYSILCEENYIWFGSLLGLIRYNIKGKNYITYNTTNSGLVSNDIYSLLKDSSDRLWIATLEGICHLEAGKITTPKEIDLSEIGIVRSLFEDTEKNIWLGCEKQGLIKIKSDLSRFDHYTTKNILPDNYVSSIIEGEMGQIWITTPKGLVLYNNRTNQYSIFSLHDGIPSYTFNDGAVQKTENNIIWWGNEKGLVYLDSIKANAASKNKIYITKVVIDGFPEGRTINRLEAAPEYLNKFELSSSQVNFIFRFSDFQYDNTPSIIYEYKLEGLQDSWVKTLSGRDILIPDIPSGTFLLKIRKAGDLDSEEIFLIQKKESYLVYWLILISIIVGLLLIYTYKRFLRKIKEYKHTLDSSDAAKEKYQKSKIEIDELDSIKSLLINYMEVEAPYLNPNLKLEDVASAIDCPKMKLSQVLNQHLNTNFSNFISLYRIETFKKKASEGLLEQYTLSALAEECGFSSRSVFFNSMKKLTGQTPLEFLKDAGISF